MQRDKHWVFGIAVVTAIMAGIASLTARWAGTPQPDLFQSYAVLALAIIFFAACGSLFFYILCLAIKRTDNPLGKIKSAVAKFASPAVLLQNVAPIFLTFAFLGAFSSLKILIPVINAFSWDTTFARLDEVIFRTDPWNLTHNMVGGKGTAVIDIIYGLWLPVFGIAIVGMSLFAPIQLKRQFFISFYAVWIILGLGVATIFSSAGPCFLQLINNPDSARYTDLFPLQNAPGAAFAQQYLADGYNAGGFGFGRGISAFPSIHVAVAMLYVLASRHIHNTLFVLAVAFFIMTYFGSIHLGWHYAIDGIAGAAGSILLWRLSSRTVPLIRFRSQQELS